MSAIFEKQVQLAQQRYEELMNRKNLIDDEWYNGCFERYKYPVLTSEHTPLIWRYDFNEASNPFFMERLGINAVFNPGAIIINDTYYLVCRVEGYDRKSFFAVAESNNGIDGFRFWDFPIIRPQTDIPDTNVYDMRLILHRA